MAKKDLLRKGNFGYFLGVSEMIRNYWGGGSHKAHVLHSRVYDVADFPVSTYHCSEPETESGYEKHNASGKMVIIERECLLNLLKTTGQAIVYYVTVEFKNDDFHAHGSQRKPAKAVKPLSLALNEQNALEWEEHLLLTEK